MSYRDLPATPEKFPAWMREVADAIDNLQRGQNLAGRVSFGPVITIGNLELSAPMIGGVTHFVVTDLTTGASVTLA